MKNIFKSLLLSLVLAVALFLSQPVQADPPGVPGDHGLSNDQAPAGGGAPIGSGLLLLIGLGGAWAGKKLYKPV